MKYKKTYKTDIGNITIIEKNKKIINISYKNVYNRDYAVKETPLIKKTIDELNLYIDGKLEKFTIPIELEGTEFQLKVWEALLKIPYGEVRTYKDIAKYIGNEKAYRAVGNANNKNPIAIIVPCHRVIGVGKNIRGYAGGVDVKKKLLKVEGIDDY